MEKMGRQMNRLEKSVKQMEASESSFGDFDVDGILEGVGRDSEDDDPGGLAKKVVGGKSVRL